MVAVVYSNLVRALRFDRAVGFIRVGVAYGTLIEEDLSLLPMVRILVARATRYIARAQVID